MVKQEKQICNSLYTRPYGRSRTEAFAREFQYCGPVLAPNCSTVVPTSFLQGEGKEFRLHSRAFMLTFNNIDWVASSLLWEEFKAWAEERRQCFGATHLSCTLEQSLSSPDSSRVHFHCYFSWHGSAGVDHSSTQEWRFQSVPRGERPVRRPNGTSRHK